MATTTRFCVSKTRTGYGQPVVGSTVFSETEDMRDAYHYGTSVGGDVSDGPAPDTTQLLPTS
jgi:hypothetical protein